MRPGHLIFTTVLSAVLVGIYLGWDVISATFDFSSEGMARLGGGGQCYKLGVIGCPLCFVLILAGFFVTNLKSESSWGLNPASYSVS